MNNDNDNKNDNLYYGYQTPFTKIIFILQQIKNYIIKYTI